MSGLARRGKARGAAKAMVLKTEAQRIAIDCLAEIVLGAGLRVPVWGRAKLALETLGITAPPKATDADRR